MFLLEKAIVGGRGYWTWIAFLIAVRSGQFDDRETPSIRMLFDDRPLKRTPPPSSIQPDSHGD